MRHEFQFSFDVPFIKAALRRDLLWKGYVAGGFLLVFAVALRWWQGFWDLWLTIFLGLAAAFVVWLIHAALNTTARRVHALWSTQAPDGLIRFQLDDEGFDVLLLHSKSRYTWQGLRRLWRYDDVWLIEIVKMGSVFFPTDKAPQEVRDYIVERCRASGVRV